MKLSEKLTQHGCDMDPEQFRDAICELHKVIHPVMTVDDVLIRPLKLALPFVEVACNRLGVDLPEEVILGELLNCRKTGRVK